MRAGDQKASEIDDVVIEALTLWPLSFSPRRERDFQRLVISALSQLCVLSAFRYSATCSESRIAKGNFTGRLEDREGESAFVRMTQNSSMIRMMVMT